MHFYIQSDQQEQAQLFVEILQKNIELEVISVDEAFKNKWLKRLPEDTLTLLFDDKGLWLAVNALQNGKPQPLKMQADWLGMQKRVVNAGKKTEQLLRAVKINEETSVIDATAGLGQDSIIMAGRGALVTMLEQQPIMHALLTNSMHIVSTNPNWQKLHSRLSLHCTNAVDYFTQCIAEQTQVDVVYLDPMFPHDSYKSAQVNKGMQVLQQLAKPPTLQEEQQLLQIALKVGKKVVVKRPNQAPFLGQTVPSHSCDGDVVRYDVYEIRA